MTTRGAPLLALVALVAGGSGACLPSMAADGNAPPPGGHAIAIGGAADEIVAAPDLASSVDGGAPADLLPRHAPQDLGAADLAGFVNCYGVAVCDPGTMFCIKYHSGSPATPGNLTAGSPACFVPDDCNGNTMDCSCITQDTSLGPNCATCVDNKDGTYDCYAQQ
jgi:hypothetical protein